jgi:acetylcholinesterase
MDFYYPTFTFTFQWILDKMYSVVDLMHVLSLCTIVAGGTTTNAPTAQVKNGTYVGRYSVEYNQDFFLGMPYAQPPIGGLRFRQAQSLNDTWQGAREAWNYSPLCVGYGVSQSIRFQVT